MFKSIKTGVFALILIGTAILAKAQKTISQGMITYSMEYILTPQQRANIDVSNLPKESTVEFNGNISRTRMAFGPSLLNIYKNGDSNTGLILINIPILQKQFAGKMSKEYLEKQSGGFKYTDFKSTGIKETIAGYNAEKYNYKDDSGSTYEIWSTKDVMLPSVAIPAELNTIGGTPVKYVIYQDGIKTQLTVKSIKTQKVGPFSMEVPAGYTLKTMDQLDAMRNGVL